ncbi:MAG: hypothetical protein EOP06_27170, partial [Proteobacteria bacterium]
MIELRTRKLVAIIFLISAFYFENARATEASFQTVKVSVELSKAPGDTIEGSGLMFRGGQRIFVLTSGHVAVQNSLLSLAHFTVRTQDGTQWNAELLSNQWSSGLGLLEVKTPRFLRSQPFPQVDDFLPYSVLKSCAYGPALGSSEKTKGTLSTQN